MRVRDFCSVCMIGVVLAVFAGSGSAEEKVVSFKPETKVVAAFKNGLGFFVREGEVTTENGWAQTDVVPAASLGTFWVGSPKKGVQIERLISTQATVTRVLTASSVGDLLAANVGKKIRFTLATGFSPGMGDKGKIEGKLISCGDLTTLDPVSPTYPAYTVQYPAIASHLAIIETSTGRLAIDKGSITNVEFDDMPAMTRTVEEKVKQFKFKITGASGKTPVVMAYLQKGISWSPAYLVELEDGQKARITMQGLLINDVEDIDNAEVYFVVGYPNFVFADTTSPLSVSQSLNQFMQSLNQPANAYQYRGGYNGVIGQGIINPYGRYALGNNAGGYGGMSGGMGPSGPIGPEPTFDYSGVKETPGAPEEDLFLYSMKDVSLKKGDRGYFTLFSAEVSYEHVYEWNVTDKSGLQTSGYSNDSRNNSNLLNDKAAPQDQVWHKLRLTNSSKFPWTTAPAMASSNGQPLSQDTLDYTSKGAKGDLKVTVATDIQVTSAESEQGRESISPNVDKAVPAGWNFTKVTSAGKLQIVNHKAQIVSVAVNKSLVGVVLSSSDGATVEKPSSGVGSVNPSSLIKWNVSLKPGESKTLTYTYYSYVRY